MKTLLTILFLLPLLAVCQEEQEILNIAKRLTGLNTGTDAGFTNDAIRAAKILEEMRRTYPENYTNNKIHTKVNTRIAQDLLPSLNNQRDNTIQEPVVSDEVYEEITGEKPIDEEEAERLASEKRIQDAVNTIRRTGGNVAKQSRQLDTSQELIPYSEIEKYIKSGVFEELGYQRGIDNDAVYNERLKWYGGMDSGFFMNIIGSFMETILSIPQLIMSLINVHS